jgi:hypothetical protein
VPKYQLNSKMSTASSKPATSIPGSDSRERFYAEGDEFDYEGIEHRSTSDAPTRWQTTSRRSSSWRGYQPER